VASNPLETHGLDALRQTQERGLHILRQRGDLRIDNVAQGFDSPRHRALQIERAGTRAQLQII